MDPSDLPCNRLSIFVDSVGVRSDPEREIFLFFESVFDDDDAWTDFNGM